MIVDDEYLAGQILSEYVGRFVELELVAVCTRPTEAIELLRSEDINLLFLDIQMPGIDGFQLLASLDQQPIVVMTTARHDQAIRAYEFAIFDYLLKPIPFDRFALSVERVLLRLAEKTRPADRDSSEKFIHFKANYQHQQVGLKKILYLEGLKEYVRIVTESESYQTLASLKNLKEELDRTEFIQIHRSYIINRSKLASYGSTQVCMSNGDVIPVGRNFRKLFQDAMR